MATTITNTNIQWGPVSYFKIDTADNGVTDVGALVEGVTINYSKEMIEVTASERFSPFLVFQGTERAMVNFRVREHSMRNFALAAGLDPDDTTWGIQQSTLAGQDKDNVVVGGYTGVAEEVSGEIQRINRQDGATLAAFDSLVWWRGVVIPNFEVKYAQDFTEHDMSILLLPKSTVLTITLEGATVATFANPLFYIRRETD